VPPDSAPADATSADAVPADAPAHRIDAPARAPIDAPSAPPDVAVGTATVRIGADPWGEISIDGSARGKTPAVITLSASHHLIEVSNDHETPPRKQTFAVYLAAGETKEIFANFK
jgi:hypothetical protein